MNSLDGPRILIVDDPPSEADELERAFVAVGATVGIQTCKGALSSATADLAAVVFDWLPANRERRDSYEPGANRKSLTSSIVSLHRRMPLPPLAQFLSRNPPSLTTL